tara:strand:- start:68561 stop:68977 length:417 start_codon:yes stop_codon:yes gene_type:complete
MKKIVFLACMLTVFISCKNNSRSENKEVDNNAKTAKQNDGLTLLKGDFIYYADAAVLQTHAEVYGVVIDEKMHELDKQVQAYKNEATDMVPVEIRGIITPKPENEEGWPFRVEIKEILTVSKPNSEANNVIKLGNETI